MYKDRDVSVFRRVLRTETKRAANARFFGLLHCSRRFQELRLLLCCLESTLGCTGRINNPFLPDLVPHGKATYIGTLKRRESAAGTEVLRWASRR